MRLDPDQHAVELLRPKMRLDLGGIAKGYAVDEAMPGDSKARHHADDGRGGREHRPRRSAARASPAGGSALPRPTPIARRDSIFWLSRAAISTSGDLWQYAVIGGVRYSHLIDPHTGMALSDHSSVTVVGPDGLSTDGLSSAVAILGPEKGLKLVNETPGTAAFIVRMADGREQTYRSRKWKGLGIGD